jgi:hypothetical protein
MECWRDWREDWRELEGRSLRATRQRVWSRAVTLTPEQRAALDTLGDFTEDEFFQPHYAGDLLKRLRSLDPPLGVDDATQWAREREWSDSMAGWLAGVAWAMKYGYDPLYGEPLA